MKSALALVGTFAGSLAFTSDADGVVARTSAAAAGFAFALALAAGTVGGALALFKVAGVVTFAVLVVHLSFLVSVIIFIPN